ANSRKGFYGFIDRVYERMLVFSMRHRLLVSILAVLVVASSVPLYRSVRQEFVPSDVDEAEFEIRMEGPQGASPTAMSDAMLAIEGVLRSRPSVRLVLASRGGGFLGTANQAQLYVRIA